jgi:hypothetical protein
MSLGHGASIHRNGLIMCLDAANIKSYPGTGTNWFNLNGSSNNATLVNSPSYTSGVNGYFTMDGVDDTITTPIPITSTPALSNFTYEVWTSLTAFPGIVSPANPNGEVLKMGVLIGAAYYSGAAIFWEGNNTGTGCVVYGFIRGADAYRTTSTYALSLNTIYQLTLVNNSSAGLISLYVNGALYHSTTTATQDYDSGLTSTAGNIGFCKSQVGGGGTYNYTPYGGRIYGGKIYTTALTANQVAQNFNALRGRYGI